MKIGLIDVDSHNFPNLPLMKISGYYKDQGHNVDFVNENCEYDKVYCSKVFTESIEPSIKFKANKVIKGGSGYDLMNKLPYEIEHQYPDYDLYPDFKYALGWLTRGCHRVNHSFCITPKKDGCKVRRTADLTEFWNGQKDVVLLDQNLLACKDRGICFDQMIKSSARFEFNGGLDVRFINESVIKKLMDINVKEYHLAWDDPREDLFDNFKLFAESGLAKPNQVGVYVLVNFWSTIQEDLERIYALRHLGFVPYVMVYDKQKYVDKKGNWLKNINASHEQLIHFKVCQHMQRWANTRQIIKTVPDFGDYTPFKKWMNKGMPVPIGSQMSMF